MTFVLQNKNINKYKFKMPLQVSVGWFYGAQNIILL